MSTTCSLVFSFKTHAHRICGFAYLPQIISDLKMKTDIGSTQLEGKEPREKETRINYQKLTIKK